jgi:hypothetical protein
MKLRPWWEATQRSWLHKIFKNTLKDRYTEKTNAKQSACKKWCSRCNENSKTRDSNNSERKRMKGDSWLSSIDKNKKETLTLVLLQWWTLIGTDKTSEWKCHRWDKFKWWLRIRIEPTTTAVASRCQGSLKYPNSIEEVEWIRISSSSSSCQHHYLQLLRPNSNNKHRLMEVEPKMLQTIKLNSKHRWLCKRQLQIDMALFHLCRRQALICKKMVNRLILLRVKSN